MALFLYVLVDFRLNAICGPEDNGFTDIIAFTCDWSQIASEITALLSV